MMRRGNPPSDPIKPHNSISDYLCRLRIIRTCGELGGETEDEDETTTHPSLPKWFNRFSRSEGMYPSKTLYSQAVLWE